MGLALVGGGVFLTYEDARHAREQAQAEEARRSAIDPKQTRAATLVGRWVASSGEVLEASMDGALVSFTVARAPAGSLYAEGDLAFKILVESLEMDLPIRLMVHPSFPASLKLDGQIIEKCREEWTTFGEAPLKVHLEDRMLVVDTVKLTVMVAGLDLSGGKIKGCKPFDRSKATKVRWVITREPSTP